MYLFLFLILPISTTWGHGKKYCIACKDKGAQKLELYWQVQIFVEMSSWGKENDLICAFAYKTNYIFASLIWYVRQLVEKTNN